MGKKENKIKQINTEYYKEQNKEENEFIKFKNQEDIRVNKQHELEKNESKFDEVVNKIQTGMLDYINYQGLALLENINRENLENYVKFVLNGCPKKKQFKNSHEIYDCPAEDNITPNKIIKQNNTNEKEIIHHGMKILEHDYVTEYGGELPEHFHNRLVTQYGINEYYDTVINLGTEYFDKTRRDVANKLGHEAAKAAGSKKKDTFYKIKFRKK